MREPVALARIARDARADDVLPRGQPAFVARDDVIEIQVLPVEMLAAILAGILVALEDVVPRELHLLPRHPVEQHQHDDARHADLEGDRVDHFVVRLAVGKVAPALEVVRLEIVCAVGIDDLRMARAKERESPADRADIDRLPETVQNEDLAVEHNGRTAPAGAGGKLRGSYHPPSEPSTRTPLRSAEGLRSPAPGELHTNRRERTRLLLHIPC